ncbi:hypothetical protein TPAR_02252 [Tolypocladium paradoxum]|uniref:Uncharacterized protein n=1 Tax=Tolypocladium paradoxum TaxID=94208 RepID=A0A2S4L555_9HYPO|nr:hypothetical protein TPAR_02252 [Tolypocladium paradoxum]
MAARPEIGPTRAMKPKEGTTRPPIARVPARADAKGDSWETTTNIDHGLFRANYMMRTMTDCIQAITDVHDPSWLTKLVCWTARVWRLTLYLRVFPMHDVSHLSTHQLQAAASWSATAAENTLPRHLTSKTFSLNHREHPSISGTLPTQLAIEKRRRPLSDESIDGP